MRVSSYTVAIKEYLAQEFLLVHGLYGTFDEVSFEIGTILDDWHGEEIPDEILSKIDENALSVLINRHYLTEKSYEEEHAFFVHLSNYYYSKDRNELNCGLVLTYSCNLNCVYCFEKYLRKKETFRDTILSSNQIDQFFQFVDSQIQQGKTVSTIELYGGEPLFSKTKEPVTRIVQKSSERGIKLMAISNGYELDSFEEYLGPDKISYIMISVDGTREAHNLRRPAANGNPTYDAIINNIDIALNAGTSICLRVNVDKTNLESLIVISEVCVEKGWSANPLFKMRYAITQHVSSKTEISGSDVYAFIRENAINHPALLQLISTQDDGNLNDLLSGEFMFHNTVGCGAVIGGMFFAPDNKLYSCAECVGNERFSIGTFDSGICLNNQKLSEWQSQHVPLIEQCDDCPIVLLCGGGCALRRLQGNLKQGYPHCDYLQSFKDKLRTEYFFHSYRKENEQ